MGVCMNMYVLCMQVHLSAHMTECTIVHRVCMHALDAYLLCLPVVGENEVGC